MKIITDDGKEFSSMESYKKYEASKDSEKEKLLGTIGTMKEKLDDLKAKLADLIDQYAEKYSAEEDLDDLIEALGFDLDDCDCDDDEYIFDAAMEFIENFERLQNLVHRLD